MNHQPYDTVGYHLFDALTDGLETDCVKTEPIWFRLYYEVLGPDNEYPGPRLILLMDGFTPSITHVFAMLPDGSMTVEQALLRWGKTSKHRDIIRALLQAAIDYRIQQLKSF